jgi:hypothetical protein
MSGTNFSPVSENNTIDNGKMQQSNVSLNLLLESRFVYVNERSNLSLTIINSDTTENNYSIQIIAPQINFQDIFTNIWSGYYTNNISVSPHSSVEINLEFWVTLNKIEVISTVQLINATLLDESSNISITDTSTWIWVYSDFNSMNLPHIPITDINSTKRSRVYEDQYIEVNYFLSFKESTSNLGIVNIWIHNTIAWSQDYRIFLTSQSEYLRFDSVFNDRGFACNLVCGDKNLYTTEFSYLLPEGSVWALIPFTFQLYLDGIKIIDQKLVVEISKFQKDPPFTKYVIKGVYTQDISGSIIHEIRSDLLKENVLPFGLYIEDEKNTDIEIIEAFTPSDYLTFTTKTTSNFQERSLAALVLFYSDTDFSSFTFVRVIFQFENEKIKTSTTNDASLSYPPIFLLIGFLTLFIIIRKRRIRGQ